MFFVAEIRATQGISKKVAKLTCQEKLGIFLEFFKKN